MHAEEFVLIPKRMFISKNPTKEEIFDNPLYQQKATQLTLLQIMLELKLVDENKTKRAAIILNKIFNSNNVSISEETNILHINDEPQGLDLASFLYNLQQPTKKLTCQSFPKS